MRISDWSSDVCPSDLNLPTVLAPIGGAMPKLGETAHEQGRFSRANLADNHQNLSTLHLKRYVLQDRLVWRLVRSEEHTSELQSLMRISYAVFCLKKKKHKQHHNTKYITDIKSEYKHKQ